MHRSLVTSQSERAVEGGSSRDGRLEGESESERDETGAWEREKEREMGSGRGRAGDEAKAQR